MAVRAPHLDEGGSAAGTGQALPRELEQPWVVMEHFLVYCSQVGPRPTVEAETKVRAWVCLSLSWQVGVCLPASVMTMAGDL